VLALNLSALLVAYHCKKNALEAKIIKKAQNPIVHTNVLFFF